MIAISPRRRQTLDTIHERMRSRLVLLKLNLIDVFALSLYHPEDGADTRVLDLLEQLAGDVRALQSGLRRWDAEYLKGSRGKPQVRGADVPMTTARLQVDALKKTLKEIA